MSLHRSIYLLPGILYLFLGNLLANPQDPQVTFGKATINSSSNSVLEITTSEKAVIHWKEFSIQHGETTRFIQPSENSLVMNRVDTFTRSMIDGMLEANGRVYLINPTGVIVGHGAIVNTASFIAAASNILDAEFIAQGDLNFQGDSTGVVINYGTINAWDGNVILLGYQIENQGIITAPSGMVALAAGQNILLQTDGNILIRPSFNQSQDTGIVNSGRIEAVRTELLADGNAYGYAINLEGSIDALNLENVNGELCLRAEHGKVLIDGSLSAPGGTIEILGEQIALLDQARIHVDSDLPGKILIGGDYQGANPDIPNASQLFVAPGCEITADALSTGSGGRVILWGTEANRFYGQVLARGGNEAGNGGFVEVSSKGHFDFQGRVDTSALNGKTGSLLLDPCMVTIGGVDSGVPLVLGGCGFLTDTAFNFAGFSSANISVAVLQGLLGSNDVCIDASHTGNLSPGLGTITVIDDVTWPSGHTLSLVADDFITVDATLQSTFASFPSATNSISLTAPTINVGDGNQLVTERAAVMAASGTIDITLEGGNLNMLPSSPTSMSMFVGTHGTTNGTNLTISGGDSIIITGGTASSSELGLQVDGTLTIMDMTGAIMMTGATGNANQISGATVNITIDGDIILDGTPTNSNPVVITSLNDMMVSAQDLMLTAGSSANNPAAAITAGGNMTSGSGRMTMNVRDIMITAGSSMSGNTAEAGIAAAYLPGTSGDFMLMARDITLQAGNADVNFFTGATLGTGKNSSDNIITSGPGGNGKLTIIANDITLIGGTNRGNASFIGTSGTLQNDVSITCNNLTMSVIGPPAPMNTFAFIIGGEPDIAEGGGAIFIQAAGNITMTGGDATHPVGILNSSTSVGDITVIAGGNLSTSAGGLIATQGSGSIYIVVDNAPPYNTPPNIGPGMLTLGGTVGGEMGFVPVRIFSSTLAQTSITATLNGQSFAPPANVVEGVWYSTFSGGGGSPFTVYVKGAISPPTPNIPATSGFLTKFSPASVQALRNWDIFYDYNSFSYIDYQIAYNREAYKSVFSYPFSSYLVCPDSTYQSVREEYRNYNLLKLDQL